jgi:hypothetical protein
MNGFGNHVHHRMFYNAKLNFVFWTGANWR